MIDPTKKALAISEFRMRFLRLYYGATDEHSDDSVPADKRDDFRDHVEYNVQSNEGRLAHNLKMFGSVDGSWATVPEANRADALRFIGRNIAGYENKTEFELDLFKINQEEALERAFDKSIASARK